MGLTSLARLNRSGIYDYWDDSWNTNSLYKQYFFSIIVIKVLIDRKSVV